MSVVEFVVRRIASLLVLTGLVWTGFVGEGSAQQGARSIAAADQLKDRIRARVSERIAELRSCPGVRATQSISFFGVQAGNGHVPESDRRDLNAVILQSLNQSSGINDATEMEANSTLAQIVSTSNASIAEIKETLNEQYSRPLLVVLRTGRPAPNIIQLGFTFFARNDDQKRYQCNRTAIVYFDAATFRPVQRPRFQGEFVSYRSAIRQVFKIIGPRISKAENLLFRGQMSTGGDCSLSRDLEDDVVNEYFSQPDIGRLPPIEIDAQGAAPASTGLVLRFEVRPTVDEHRGQAVTLTSELRQGRRIINRLKQDVVVRQNRLDGCPEFDVNDAGSQRPSSEPVEPVVDVQAMRRCERTRRRFRRADSCDLKVDAWDEYLILYPTGLCAEEGREAIAKLEQNCSDTPAQPAVDTECEIARVATRQAVSCPEMRFAKGRWEAYLRGKSRGACADEAREATSRISKQLANFCRTVQSEPADPVKPNSTSVNPVRQTWALPNGTYAGVRGYNSVSRSKRAHCARSYDFTVTVSNGRISFFSDGRQFNGRISRQGRVDIDSRRGDVGRSTKTGKRLKNRLYVRGPYGSAEMYSGYCGNGYFRIEG